MADMIDAKDAKQLLGVDDATLNDHINKGRIKAQRVGGKLMLNKDDVETLVREKDDEGTIVLTGDSDNLQIDLGKVVDDGSETLASSRKPPEASDSITFGEELEVVNFDDGNTKDLSQEQTRPTKAGVSFTDSNTAVVTAVDETNVGGTTGPIAFTTDQVDPPRQSSSNESARRSVRSNRARAEDTPVHWMWLALLIMTFLVSAFFCAPYFVLRMWPTDQKDAAKNVLHGVADNLWTSMAGGMAGFSVEPNAKRHTQVTGGQHVNNPDRSVEWRGRRFLTPKGSTDPVSDKERVKTFIIVKIQDDKTAISAGGQSYVISESAVRIGDSSVTVRFPDVGFGNIGIGSTAK